MKALTISQPFAELIANGEKFVENRNYRTHYRGPLAIHAGKGTQYLYRSELSQYQTGCIVAVADLVACLPCRNIQFFNSHPIRNQVVPGTTRTWAEIAQHAHTEGPWCWILDNVRRVEPIPLRGAQGLFDVDDALFAEMKTNGQPAA